MQRAAYRVRQFGQLLAGRLGDPDRRQIAGWLTPPLLTLFAAMSPAEQYHAYRVRQTLARAGYHHPDLLTAALLHDTGKTKMPLAFWERVLIVLAFKFAPLLAARWGCDESPRPEWYRRAFVVARHHAKWGAQMVQAAGGSGLTVELVRRHQDKISESGSVSDSAGGLLWALQWADNLN